MSNCSAVGYAETAKGSDTREAKHESPPLEKWTNEIERQRVQLLHGAGTALSGKVQISILSGVKPYKSYFLSISQ